jgi:hypothetical protein
MGRIWAVDEVETSWKIERFHISHRKIPNPPMVKQDEDPFGFFQPLWMSARKISTPSTQP